MQVNVKKHLIYGSIAAVWMILPAYVIVTGILSTGIVDGTCTPWGVHSSFAAEKAQSSATFFIALLFPLTLMVFCYWKIVYELKHKVTVHCIIIHPRLPDLLCPNMTFIILACH